MGSFVVEDSRMVLLIFFLALLIRLSFSFLPSFEIDFAGWIAWGERLVQLGPANFYSREVWTNYMPGYLYVLWFLGEVRNLAQIPLNSKLYEVILKLPANLADLGIGFLIFKITKNYISEKKAVLATSLYIFNPVTIFNSAVWGQIDSVFTFFLLLASFYLVELKRSTSSSLSIFTSFVIKPQALALFPIFFVKLQKNTGLRKTLTATILGLIFIFLIALPFFIKNPVTGLPKMFFQMSTDYPFTSLFAFNLWWLFGGWQNDSILTLGLPAQIWGLGLWILSQILIIFWILKNQKSKNFYLAAAASLLSFFLFPTRVHERYLFPFFAFGAITASIFGRIFWLIWGVLTLIHFANLYFVYTYYTPNFLKINFLTKLIDNLSILLTVMTVFIFSLMIGLLFGKRWSKT